MTLNFVIILLPVPVRPKGTSELRSIRIARDSECKLCDPSKLVTRLSKTFEISIIIILLVSKAVVNTVKYIVSREIIDKQPQLQIDAILKGVKVVTINVVMFLNKMNASIGKIKFLEKNNLGCTLYLDATPKRGSLRQIHLMFSDLADLLLSIVQHCTSVPTYEIKESFQYFLMAESASNIIQHLESKCVPNTDVTADENVTLSIGTEIPQEWHYHLDQ